MKKQIWFPLIYTAFCLSLVSFVACSNAVPRKKTTASQADFADSVSCEESSAALNSTLSSKKFKSQKLTPGLYDYKKGEIFFIGKINDQDVRYHASESVAFDAKEKKYNIKPSFDCYEGFLKNPNLNFKMDEAKGPRTLILVDTKKRDVLYRQYGFISDRGQPFLDFTEAGQVHGQASDDLENDLSHEWKEQGFIHSGVKTYTFIGKKEIDDGTLMVRITYQKRDGNALKDGDFFLAPLSEVSHSLWDHI